MASKLHVKKGDKVEIISGKDKKKTGKVLRRCDGWAQRVGYSRGHRELNLPAL